METGFLDIDGLRLEMARTGPKTGPQLVLLHEGLGCVALWRDLPQRLAEATGLGVLAWSRAGYGHSDPVPLPWPLDYMTQEATQVLGRVLDAAAVDDCILIGHSDGATIVAEHLGRTSAPGVRGGVLIAPHFFTEPDQLRAIDATRTAFETGPLRHKLARYHRHVDCAFRGWSGAWLAPGFRHWNVEQVIDGISVPLLTVQGEADPYGSLRQVRCVADRAAGPVETLILPGVGHAPHRQAPAAFDRAVTGWIARLCTG